MDTNLFKYWKWLRKSGYKRLFNRWLFFHFLAGFIIAIIVQSKCEDAANTVLLPLAGIFIGLSFAWSGNAQALLQSKEIRKMAKKRKGGYKEYVYTFQTAILVIMVTIIGWGIAGLSVFDDVYPTTESRYLYFFVKWVLFTLTSLTVRECWHVVLGTQWLILAQSEIEEAENQEISES